MKVGFLGLGAMGGAMAAGLAVCGLTMGALSGAATPAQAQQTIRVGWTIPAEEAKYWMMRRPAEFPDIGKAYKIEWVQFQGTAPMTQALAAGALDCATQGVLSLAQGAASGNLKAYIVAQHVYEKPGGFSVYWAVKDDSPIKTIADLKGKTMAINVLGSGIYGPMALLLKQHGVDPEKDIKLVELGFSLSEDAVRSGRVDAGQLGRAIRGQIELAQAGGRTATIEFDPCPGQSQWPNQFGVSGPLGERDKLAQLRPVRWPAQFDPRQHGGVAGGDVHRLRHRRC